MATIFGRIRDYFRGKKPKAPALPGNRGIAAGSLKKPDLERYAERVERRQEYIPANEVEDFLYNEGLLFVNSSNVGAVQYFEQDRKLMVEFLGGSAYLYSNVSLEEAKSFANAQSKGAWVWDNLRVRGSKTAHRKPYSRIR